MHLSAKLSDRQLKVLRWIADGCPPQEWPDETHKNTALALSNRRLVVVHRKSKQRPWSAEITAQGREALATGAVPQPPDSGVRAEQRQRRGSVEFESSVPPDGTARAMRAVQKRRRPNTIAHTKREIRETFMRYKVVVTRVQVAERFVRATDEDDAAKKVQAEFDRPYGYFGSWKTTTSEVDVVEAESTTVIHPTHLSASGPMLLSIKDAAAALGLPYSGLYSMVNSGEIEWVLVGSRKYISRESLLDFIKVNTHKGYYAAR